MNNQSADVKSKTDLDKAGFFVCLFGLVWFGFFQFSAR